MKNEYEDKVLEILSEQPIRKAPELTPEFKEHLLEKVTEGIHDPERRAEEDDRFWETLEARKDDIDEEYRSFTAKIQDPDESEGSEQESGSNIVRLPRGKSFFTNPQWRMLISVAAVFIFLITGTLLSRESLHNPGNHG